MILITFWFKIVHKKEMGLIFFKFIVYFLEIMFLVICYFEDKDVLDNNRGEAPLFHPILAPVTFEKRDHTFFKNSTLFRQQLCCLKFHHLTGVIKFVKQKCDRHG